MPQSRHRKNHKKKVKNFKQRAVATKNAEIKEYKEKMEEVYKQAQALQEEGKPKAKPKAEEPMKIESGAISTDSKNNNNNLNKIKI